MRDAARKPWEAAVPVARANRQWTPLRRREALTMTHIAFGLPPARRIARAISMGLYQRDLVLGDQLGDVGRQREGAQMNLGRVVAGLDGGGREAGPKCVQWSPARRGIVAGPASLQCCRVPKAGC